MGGVDHSSITMLARQLGKVPIELRRELRPKIRASADHVVADMKARASYSSRIPGAIRTTVSFAGGRGRSGGGITIRANAARAPHARVLERGNLGGRAATFRHPVFPWSSNRSDWTWVNQPTRPFFFPAIKAGRAQLKKNIAEAVSASLRKVTR